MSEEEVHPTTEVVEVIVPVEVVAEPTPVDALLAEPVVVEAQMAKKEEERAVTAPLKPALRSVVVMGPALLIPMEPPVFNTPLGPSTALIPKVLNFISKTLRSNLFVFLSLLDIDYDTTIPSYFDDPFLMVRLARLLPPQITEPLENMLDDDELMEITGENFTPRKRRAAKPKEQLDDRFLRRNKRNVVKLDGFKTAPAQVDKNALDQVHKDDVLNPMPLAIIPAPSSTPTPHLTKNVIEGIATGFL
jgi:hypothetical protein